MLSHICLSFVIAVKNKTFICLWWPSVENHHELLYIFYLFAKSLKDFSVVYFELILTFP